MSVGNGWCIHTTKYYMYAHIIYRSESQDNNKTLTYM